MANNYTQATITPDIPRQDITRLELAILETVGAAYYTEKDTHYLYFPEYFGFAEYQDYEDELLAEDIDDPRNTSYFTDGKLDEGISVEDILSNIVHRSETLEYLIVEGCYSCDKMRQGEFGGFALVVTGSEVRRMVTNYWVHEQITTLRNNHHEQ